MVEIKSFPNNVDTYFGAEDVMKWLHGRTSGVFAAKNNAAVAQLSEAAMAVTVSDGKGWMSNSDGDGIVWWNDNYSVNGLMLQLDIDAADGVLNRIDRVIVEWTMGNYVKRPEIKILKGTTASAAVAPALTNNSTVRQISLARINVAAGTTAITASMITDERLDNTVCGLVTESVTVDTSVVNAQFEALLEQLESAIAQAWEGEISDGAITEEKLSESFILPIDKGGTGATTTDEIKTLLGLDSVGVNIVKIWENAKPTSAYADTTETLEIASDDFVMIGFRSGDDTSARKYIILPCGGYGHVHLFYSQYSVRRRADVSTTGVKFGDGESNSGGYKTWATDNEKAIPICIYRIKGVQ